MTSWIKHFLGFDDYSYYHVTKDNLKDILDPTKNEHKELRNKIINLAKKVDAYKSKTDDQILNQMNLDLENKDDAFIAIVNKDNCLAFLYLSKDKRNELINSKNKCQKVKIYNVIIDGDNCDDKKVFVYAIGYALKKLALGDDDDYEITYKLKKKDDGQYKVVVKCLERFGFKLYETYYEPYPLLSDIEVWTLPSLNPLWYDLLFDRYVGWVDEITIF